MEDVQPNEVRLSRKGSSSIPPIRTTRYQKSPYKRWRRDNKNAAPHHAIARVTKVPARDIAQGNGPGPSRTNPAPRRVTGPLRGRPQCLGNSPSIPPTDPPVRRRLPGTSLADFNSRPVQTSSNLRHKPAVHSTRSTGSIIDLTLDLPSPPVVDNPDRWLIFRSGRMGVSLPASNNGLRASPPEPKTNPRSSVQQGPAQVVECLESVHLACSSDTNLRVHRSQDTVPLPLREDRRTGGSHPDTLDKTRPSHSSNHSGALDDIVEMSPTSRNNLLVRDFTVPCGKLLLSRGPHDKPRRVLPNGDFAYVVTAHGVIDQVRPTGVLKWDRNVRSPPMPLEEFVDDACVLSHHEEPVIVLGHAREQHQITVLKLGHSQGFRCITLHRNWNTMKKHGVSAVTSLMSPLKFVSGGYDHRVHIWDIVQDFDNASTVELAIKHSSVIHSLLPIVDSSHKLVSVGADCSAHIYDISAERVVQTLKMSCIPFHAHGTNSPSCTLFEVAHLETQFEVRDYRTSHQVAQRFGFITEERRGRYEKAGTWSHFVACGDKNGAVHLWDFRNVSTEVALQQCFNDPVMQAVKVGSHLLACSKKNELVHVDFPGVGG